MNFPIFIIPCEGGQRYSASLGAPFNVTVEAPTTGEVEEKVSNLIKEQIRQQGGEIRWLTLPGQLVGPGWLPDDDLTREWLECMEHYRDQCDKEDRQRILGESGDTE